MQLRSLLLALALAPVNQVLAQSSGPATDSDERPPERREAAPSETPAGHADATPKEEVRPPAALAAPTPLPLASSNTAHHVAYAEAFRILEGDNECSRFFGGAGVALEVLNRMAARMRASPLREPTTCFKMQGDYTIVKNQRTGAVFRVFDEVTVNSIGPVSRTPSQAAAKLSVGSFPAHTKSAWVLVLLHELGHLVRGENGDWLLPNDGRDARLSRINTARVESRCLEQLNAVR